MAQITASFPFKHPSDKRMVKIGETLEVDDEYARQKITDGHASAMVIGDVPGSPERPQPTFVTDFVSDPQPIGDVQPVDEVVSQESPEPAAPAQPEPPVEQNIPVQPSGDSKSSGGGKSKKG